MAHHELMVTLPTLALAGGYQIVLEAIDPSTGSIVPGSSVSSIVIFAAGLQGAAGGGAVVGIYDQTWLPVPPVGLETVGGAAV